MASTEPQGNTAKWFTPTRLLGLFCVMSFLVYVDRGVMSSAAVSGAPRSDDNKGYGLQGDFDVSYASYGALQAAFMLGLLTGAPMFSALAKTWNPFKLIGCGLGGGWSRQRGAQCPHLRRCCRHSGALGNTFTSLESRSWSWGKDF